MKRWKATVGRITRQAVEWAGDRPVWMVLQGHGRRDWYEYGTTHIGYQMPEEFGARPSAEILQTMANEALGSGADGIWWWSFEIYDWADPSHQAFIRQFGQVNRAIQKAAE
ncbi:MAG: hypothetical protein ACRD1R_04600 [Acidobacteriota bacterium]